MQLFDPKWDPHRIGIFEPMPFTGNENMLTDMGGRDIIGEDEEEDDTPTHQVEEDQADTPPLNEMDDIFGIISMEPSEEIATPVAAAPSTGMEDIFGTLGASAPQEVAQPAPVSADPLAGLFGGPSPVATPAPFAAPASDPLAGLTAQAPAPVVPTKPSFIGFEDTNIKAVIVCERQGANVHSFATEYSNLGAGNISDLNMQVSVKKYLALELFSVSSSILAPQQANGSTQRFNITNS